jgi:hypothetical protein
MRLSLDVLLSSPLQLQMRGMKRREKSNKQQLIECLLMFHLLRKVDQTNYFAIFMPPLLFQISGS